VLTITIPTLEERREDIPALVGHFAQGQARHRETCVNYATRLTVWRCFPTTT
jgi:transcriptional regulator with AAA-type ATPase domain